MSKNNKPLSDSSDDEFVVKKEDLYDTNVSQEAKNDNEILPNTYTQSDHKLFMFNARQLDRPETLLHNRLMKEQVTNQYEKLRIERPTKKSKELYFNGVQKFTQRFYYRINLFFASHAEPVEKVIDTLIEYYLKGPALTWARQIREELYSEHDPDTRVMKFWIRFADEYLYPGILPAIKQQMLALNEPDPNKHRIEMNELRKVYKSIRALIEATNRRKYILVYTLLDSELINAKLRIWSCSKVRNKVFQRRTLYASQDGTQNFTLEEFFDIVIEQYNAYYQEAIARCDPNRCTNDLDKSNTDRMKRYAINLLCGKKNNTQNTNRTNTSRSRHINDCPERNTEHKSYYGNQNNVTCDKCNEVHPSGTHCSYNMTSYVPESTPQNENTTEVIENDNVDTHQVPQ